MWCASPLSIFTSINSRALSSASRCLLSSLTTPPLSLGQTPLFMILSNPHDTDICSLIGDILCEELARQLAGIRPLHAEQKERDSWVFLTGFSDARRSLGSNQYHQPPTALATRDTSQLTLTSRRYSATATCSRPRRPRRSSRPTKRRLRSLRQASEQRRCVSWLRRHRRVKGRR